MVLPIRRILLSSTPAWVLKGAAIDLDFANQRYYKGSPTGSLSISRASNGYAQTSAGLLVNFANDTLRITNQGLLIEEARTNLCKQSADFSTTWAPTLETVTVNDTTAPDNTVTADKIVENNASSFIIQTAITVVSGSVYTVSVYVKPSNITWMTLFLTDTGALVNGSQAWFNLSGAGSVGASVTNFGVGWTGGTPTIQAVANGFYRINFPVTTGAITFALGFYSVTADGGNTRVTTGTYWTWGAQVELGAFPTSYIPTTTVSVTRAADVVSLSGAFLSLMASSSFSAVVKAGPNTTVGTRAARLIGRGNNTAAYLAEGGGGSGTSSNTFDGTHSATSTNGNSQMWIANSMKAAMGYTFGVGSSIVSSGGTVVTSATMDFSAATTVELGGGNSSLFWDAYIQRVSAWPLKLPDATLQAMTYP